MTQQNQTTRIAPAVRICILGAGNHSRSNHGPALRKMVREGSLTVELAAVCDKDATLAESYRQEFGFARSYIDVDDMLSKERPDGLMVILPYQIQPKVVIPLLSTSATLLIEKPPAKTAEEAKELLREAQAAHARVMVSMNRRFSPMVDRAWSWLKRKQRTPRYIQATMHRINRTEPCFISATGIHLIDTVMMFGKKVSSLEIHRTMEPTPSLQAEAKLMFDNGCIADVKIDPDTDEIAERIHIQGKDYEIDIDVRNRTLRITDKGNLVDHFALEEDVEPFVASGSYEETCAFIRCIQTGQPPCPSLAQSVDSLIVAEAMEKGLSIKLLS